MRTTQSEAGRKLCPITMTEDHRDRCEGSNCMAWRWHQMPINKFHRAFGDLQDEPERPGHVPAHWIWYPYDPIDDGGSLWLEPDEDCDARRTGFCGLAGEAEHA